MWLLLQDVMTRIETAEAQGWQPTAEQLNEFMAEDRLTGDRIMSLAGDKAEILVQGALSKAPSFLARFFGGGNTTYAELAAAVAAADANPNVGEIVFRFDSPGGQISGMFDGMAAIANAQKPTRGIVEMAASACYGLASQCDTLEAASEGAMVGSVGVVAQVSVNSSVVQITSSNAPNKRPDVTTEEGRAQVREFLDEVEAQFIDEIAAGRDVSAETVRADFGRGGMMLAKKALAQKMIDGIMEASSQGSALSVDADHSPAEGENKMTLEELKAAHPDLFAQVVQIGVSQERERCDAHLTLGAMGGEAGMRLATDAIKAGTDFGPKVNADYQAAAINVMGTKDRTEDDANTDGTAQAADHVAKEGTEEENPEDAVHEAVLKDLGFEEGGE